MNFELITQIYLLIICIIFLIYDLKITKKQVVIIEQAYVFMGLALTMGFCILAVIDDEFYGFLSPIYIVSISVYILYNANRNKFFLYINSYQDTAREIVEEVLQDKGIPYTVNEYKEFVLKGTKAKIDVQHQKLKMIRYRSFQNHTELLGEIKRQFIAKGYTGYYWHKTITILIWIAFIAYIIYQLMR